MNVNFSPPWTLHAPQSSRQRAFSRQSKLRRTKIDRRARARAERRPISARADRHELIGQVEAVLAAGKCRGDISTTTIMDNDRKQVVEHCAFLFRITAHPTQLVSKTEIVKIDKISGISICIMMSYCY